MDIKQISYTKFRMHLASFINKVVQSNLPILIVRRNHEPAYLVSKEMYEHLIKLHFSKSEKSINATSVESRTKSLTQKPVQVETTTQQDLFN